MRVGIISTEYLPATGGAQTYLENLIKVLEPAGYRCTVYQFNNGVSSPKVILLPHKPKFLPGGRALDLWWYNLILLFQQPRLAKEDILIVNYAFHSWPVWWHKRVLVLSHGCEWDIPPTSISQQLKIQIAKWSFNHFRNLVANDTNYFRQMGINIKPKEKIFEQVLPGKWFAPNAVDTTVFKRVRPDPEIAKLNSILVPRNISYARGVHLAIQAYALFRKKFPNTNLVIVGDFFDRDYKDYILQLVKDLKLSKSIKFMGNISWSKMPQVYSAGLMTIIPTLQREGTSLSGLESMACGTVTVTTDRWGLADLPSVQAVANPESLAKAMLATFPKRNQIATQQKKSVLNQYNLKVWGNTWIKVLREVSNADND